MRTRARNGTVFVASCIAFVAFGARADAPSVGAVEWTVAAPATVPPARFAFAVAQHAVRGETILFGGQASLGTVVADTWAWNGASWVERTAAPSPSARRGHAMAFDDARGKVLLFGGEPCTSGCAALADTWEFDGKSWKLLAPPVSPMARTTHSMAYDPTRKKVVLFGGCSDPMNPRGSLLDDTWEWDGATWSPVTVATKPTPVRSASMQFDGAGIVLYGGYGGVGPPGPPPVSGQTWHYDGVSWTKQSPAIAPTPRADAAVAFDAARQRVVVYGGRACSSGMCSGYQEIWEWNGVSWRERSPSLVVPNDSGSAALAYDPTRRRTVLVRSDGSPSMIVWELLGYAESCTSDQQCDTSSCNGGVCCKVACGPCSDCDVTGTRCVPVRSKDDVESCTGVSTCNELAECKRKLGQACAGPDECASGLCTTGVCCSVERCGAFACDTGGSCNVSCTTDAQCAPGNTCAGGQCVHSTVTCDGNVAVDVTTGARTTCAPYACGVEGCLGTCSSSDECSPGALCDAQKNCTAPPASADASCTSSRPAGGSSSSWALGLLGLGAWIVGRARRNGASR